MLSEQEDSHSQNLKYLMYINTDVQRGKDQNEINPNIHQQVGASESFDEDDHGNLMNKQRFQESEPLFQANSGQQLFPVDPNGDPSSSDSESQYTGPSQNDLQARNKHILQKHLLKKIKSKKKIKNGNMPKFLTRLLFDRGVQYLDEFKDHEMLQKQFVQFTKRQKQKCKEDKNRNNRVCDILRIFGHAIKNSRETKRSNILRKVMNKILRAHLTEHVIKNPQVKLTKEYLISLKVYGLRCRNLSLMERLEFR